MQDGEALTHGKSSAQLNPAAKAENSDNMYPCTHTQASFGTGPLTSAQGAFFRLQSDTTMWVLFEINSRGRFPLRFPLHPAMLFFPYFPRSNHQGSVRVLL